MKEKNIFRELRIKKGLTRKELSKRCNIPERTIRAYENNDRNIKKASVETVYNLLTQLSYSYVEFMINLEDLLKE